MAMEEGLKRYIKVIKTRQNVAESLAQESACLSSTRPWAQSSASHEEGLVIHTNASHGSSEGKTGDSGAQHHSWLQGEFEISVEYMRPFQKHQHTHMEAR